MSLPIPVLLGVSFSLPLGFGVSPDFPLLGGVSLFRCPLLHLLVLVRMPPVSALRRSLKAEVHPNGGVPQGNGTILSVLVSPFLLPSDLLKFVAFALAFDD